MRRLQHVVVVAVDRQIGVHIAVARMHVQGSPHTAFEHALVHSDAFGQNARERAARENAGQRRFELGFPAGAQAVVLQLRKQRIDIMQPA